MDRLIVMDDVLGIADNCKKFAEFLTVCRKYRYHCIYVFHIIMPENQIWKKILSHTNIFNFFPSSVPCNTAAKVLQSKDMKKLLSTLTEELDVQKKKEKKNNNKI